MVQKVIFHVIGEQVLKYCTNWCVQIVIIVASISLSYFGIGLLRVQKLGSISVRKNGLGLGPMTRCRWELESTA